MSDTFMLIVGIVLAVIGVLILAAVISSTRACSQKVSGKVVRVELDNTRHWRGTYPHYPIVSYVTDGKEYTVKSGTYTRISTKYETGQDVVVRYNPKKPDEIRVGLDLSSYIVGAIFLLIGLGIICIWFI